MRDYLAKYVPPLSPSQMEEIAQEHERLVAIELKKQKEALTKQEKKKGK